MEKAHILAWLASAPPCAATTTGMIEVAVDAGRENDVIRSRWAEGGGAADAYPAVQAVMVSGRQRQILGHIVSHEPRTADIYDGGGNRTIWHEIGGEWICHSSIRHMEQGAE